MSTRRRCVAVAVVAADNIVARSLPPDNRSLARRRQSVTQILESDSHRYAGARPPDRRRTCPEIVAASAIVVAVAPIVDDATDSLISAVTSATTAAALLGSARANIAVQRYILGPACGIDIGAGRRQETHDFPLDRARSSVARYPAMYRERDATSVSLFLVICRVVDALRTTRNDPFSIIISDRTRIRHSFRVKHETNFRESCLFLKLFIYSKEIDYKNLIRRIK